MKEVAEKRATVKLTLRSSTDAEESSETRVHNDEASLNGWANGTFAVAALKHGGGVPWRVGDTSDPH